STTSRFLNEGPIILLRPAFPKVPAGASAQAGDCPGAQPVAILFTRRHELNHCCTVCAPSLPSPIRFGRSTFPSTCALSALTKAVNGRPFCSVRIPESPHPPAIAAATGFVLRNGFPLPNGN